MTETDAAADSVLGRRLLLPLGGGLILLGGFLGVVVGANGAETVPELTLFGQLTVPVTPATMGLYGMVVVALALGGLYALLTIASRYDTDAQ